MRILCISNDIPLPANSGGRVDVWRRLCALRDGGHTLALVCWRDAGRDERPSPAVLKRLGEVCAEVKIMLITRSLGEIVGRLRQLWRWPSHVGSRWVSSREAGLLPWARQFRPDVVLLDGLYGGAVALDLSRQLGRQLWYRSQNIEHRYMAAQQVRERRLQRRLGLAANCFGLARYEQSVMRHASRVFDISEEDAAFWRGRGVAHIEWVPTLVDRAFASRLQECSGSECYDVLYFGNLNTPNNVEAIKWLVDRVLPLIPRHDLRLAIAGSRPSDEVCAVVKSDHRIVLIENPDDMAEVVAQARVVVNPMLAGSGVNLKSVEMLFSNAALVSTSVGVAGLPATAKGCFEVADTPDTFASAILQALDVGCDVNARSAVRTLFSPHNLLQAIDRGCAETMRTSK
jgi:hypothetical protein